MRYRNKGIGAEQSAHVALARLPNQEFPLYNAGDGQATSNLDRSVPQAAMARAGAGCSSPWRGGREQLW